MFHILVLRSFALKNDLFFRAQPPKNYISGGFKGGRRPPFRGGFERGAAPSPSGNNFLPTVVLSWSLLQGMSGYSNMVSLGEIHHVDLVILVTEGVPTPPNFTFFLSLKAHFSVTVPRLLIESSCYVICQKALSPHSHYARLGLAGPSSGDPRWLPVGT